jgi:hypothetical protein
MVPAIAAPVMAASLALSGPATAGAVVCTALSGNISGTPPPVVSGCNDTTNTGGSGTASGALAPPTGTLTWAAPAVGTTTIKFKDKILTGKKDKCPKPDGSASIKGKVSGHTGSGSSVSGKVSATVCYTSSGALSLEGTTTFKL